MEEKIKEVVKLFNLDQKSGKKLTREREIVYKRQYFIYYLRETTNLSTTHIGRLLGLDHSTIIYATKQVSGYISINDNYFYFIVKELKDYLDLNPIQVEKTLKKHNVYDIINKVLKCETLEDLNNLKKYIAE
jgi:hypothetical protein